jgi:hypothetical protein
MSRPSRKLDHVTHRRRYLLHILSVAEPRNNSHRYVARIQLWTSRPKTQNELHERFFSDERILAETLNPLLPCGSDVRDVLGHIESDDGFFYLLHLTSEEAEILGWKT